MNENGGIDCTIDLSLTWTIDWLMISFYNPSKHFTHTKFAAHVITLALLSSKVNWNEESFYKWSICRSSVGYKVEDLVELDVYNTEWVSNTRWNELEQWMCLLNTWQIRELMVSFAIQVTLKPLHSQRWTSKDDYCEIGDRLYNYFSCC